MGICGNQLSGYWCRRSTARRVGWLLAPSLLFVAGVTLADAEPVVSATASSPSSLLPAATSALPAPTGSSDPSSPLAATTNSPPATAPSGSEAAASAPPGVPLEPALEDKVGEPAAELEQILDTTLREAARDLGLEVAYQFTASEQPVDEERLLQSARGGYAFAAELIESSTAPGEWVLRLSLVPPDGQTLLVGRAPVDEENLEVRAIQLLRELARGSERRPSPEPRRSPTTFDEPPPERSQGRAVFTAHGALVGGYVGFSLEHIGGSGDARLVYPLMALGAGAGVGASLVIAEEWDISVAEAWYVWAAGTWSATSGMLIADAQSGDSDSRRYGYGLLAAASGLTLGSVALNSGQVYTGGALFTHSGALFGAGLGGIGQMLLEGDTSISPTLGIGVGMGSGLLIAGGIAPIFGRVSSSRVLFVDLSAVLGGLAGGAIASPLLVGDELSPMESRFWLGSVAAGAVGGAIVGTILTRDKPKTSELQVAPYVAILPSVGGAGKAQVLGITAAW